MGRCPCTWGMGGKDDLQVRPALQAARPPGTLPLPELEAGSLRALFPGRAGCRVYFAALGVGVRKASTFSEDTFSEETCGCRLPGDRPLGAAGAAQEEGRPVLEAALGAWREGEGRAGACLVEELDGK